MKAGLNLDSLKTKVALVVIITTLAGMLVSAAIVSQAIETQLMNKYYSEKVSEEELITQTLRPVLVLYDYAAVERIIAAEAKHELIIGITVFDERGQLIRSVKEKGVPLTGQESETRELRSDAGQALGSVEIIFSTAYVQQYIQTTVSRLVLGLVGFLIIANIIIYLVLNRLVISPLDRFKGAIGRMAQGDLSSRVDTERKDEFGVLARQFNRMAANLEKKTKAVEAEKDKLKRFAQLAIGREERMIELKKEIKRLEKGKKHG